MIILTGCCRNPADLERARDFSIIPHCESASTFWPSLLTKTLKRIHPPAVHQMFLGFCRGAYKYDIG